jgi:hypothetical protein
MSGPKSLTETEWKDLVSKLPETEFGKQETWTNGKMRFEMFPEGYQALNRELATGLHPKLEKLLANHRADDVDVKLAEIASYCQVILDGTYTLAERDKLCFILAGRLEVLREIPQSQNIILQ